MKWNVLSKEDIDVKGIQLKDLYYKHATNNADELMKSIMERNIDLKAIFRTWIDNMLFTTRMSEIKVFAKKKRWRLLKEFRLQKCE